MQAIDEQVPTPERLPLVRAIEELKMIGTDETKAVWRTWPKARRKTG